MKEKMLRSIWLRICMIVAVVTTAFAGTAWAEIHPIDVEVEGFTATSGKIDGNISYSTTGGAVSGSNLTATTFTLTATNGAKINSVSFHWTSLWVNVNWVAANENKSGSFEANMSGYNQEQNPIVSGLTCEEIAFNSNLSFDYIKVTYTPGTPAYTVTAQSSDESKGTVEVDGNVIIATPKPGYGVDDTNPYTVTVGTATVVRTGNYFAVVPSTACTVTINFVAHAGNKMINFEHPLDTYTDTDWDIQGIEPYQWEIPVFNGTYYGMINANPAYIQTKAKIEYPGTLSCWINTRSPGASDTWTIQVFSDDGENKTWKDVATKTISQKEWVQFTADLTSETDVYVRLYYTGSGTNGAVDDIVLTEGAVPVSVSSSGLSTFCCHRALDFTNSSIKVYYATAEGTTLTFHQITKVPADTGVLLQKTGGGTEDVPPLVGTPDAVTGNVFVPGAGAAVSYSDNDQKYILYQGEFFRANSNKVATNRAYIQLPTGSQVKDLTINLDADVTGIETIGDVQSTMNDAIYNLAGQRLKKMQKGINIVNGKKMIQR